MLNKESLREAFAHIAIVMEQNRQYLIELDQRNGDGDLGISMADGYAAANASIQQSSETDLGKLLIGAYKDFAEAAPSSLGTITSLGLMGMAKALVGNSEANTATVAKAMKAGIAKIMERAGSKPGEKTILDSLWPAVETLEAHANEHVKTAWHAAATAAREGSNNTANMKAIHGRAAYYGDKTIGLVDGGSVVGSLLFEAISEYVSGK